MASRYGWPPSIIDSQPWTIAQTALRKQTEAEREQYRAAAMTAFMLGAGSEGQTFGDFLSAWGLSDKPKKRSVQSQMSTEELLQWGIDKLREQGIQVNEPL